MLTTSLSAQTLVIWQKNGEQAFLNLNDNPKIMFSGENMVIATHMMTISYPVSDVLRYTYLPSSTGIEGIENGYGASISEDGSVLTLNNIKPGMEVCVYSVDGKLIEKQVSKNETIMQISLASHPSGVYVVKHNDVSYKIIKP